MADVRPPLRASDLAGLDLTEAALYRNGFPHEIFTTLRREAPVWWQAVPEGVTECADEGFWVLSKHHDIQAANRDTELFSAFDGPSLAHRPEMHGTMLVSMDGREHTRLRRLISAGFTPRMVGRLEEQMRRWAASIVDAALARGTCNFVADVAYQLPMHVIADIVGIPVEDRRWLFKLTNDFVAAGDADAGLSPEQQMAIQAEMFQYARTLGQEKRARPQDDVWTILSTVEIDTDNGGRTGLSEIELDLFFLVLTVAGSETTRNAISIGLLALLDHPEQLETLRRDPNAMGSAVEEIIRWSSPVSYFARRATPRSAECQSPPGSASHCGTRRPTATTRSSTIRSASTSSGRRTSMWPSAAVEPTTVSAPTWRAARSPSSSRSCSPAPVGSR